LAVLWLEGSWSFVLQRINANTTRLIVRYPMKPDEFFNPLLLSLRNTFRRKGRLVLTLSTLTLGGAIFIGVFSVRDGLFLTAEQKIFTFWRHDLLAFFDRPYTIHMSGSETIDDVRRIIGSQFGFIVSFLMIMALLLAVVGGLGLMGTMSINVLERTREIGVLRAIGASNGAVLRIVIVEGVLIGVISWAIGAILALPLSILLSDAVGMAFLQMPLDFVFSLRGLVVILAALTGLLAACGGTQPAAPAIPSTPVKTEDKIIAEAKVVPAQRAALSFEIGGTIAEVLVKEGDAVAAGQVIARLDRATKAVNPARAEAQIKAAEARLQDLTDGPRQQDIDAAAAQLRQAQAQIKQTLASVTPEDIAAVQVQIEAAQATLARLRAGMGSSDVRAVEA
jgi:predicted lysophospholipase L1 biosynthesis ABC-type transport system permease subunit